jgi:hypothetical protein
MSIPVFRTVSTEQLRAGIVQGRQKIADPAEEGTGLPGKIFGCLCKPGFTLFLLHERLQIFGGCADPSRGIDQDDAIDPVFVFKGIVQDQGPAPGGHGSAKRPDSRQVIK